MDKCPQCGYMEVQENKPFSHAMSKYVTADGKTHGVYNSDETTIRVQPKGSKEQITLTRKDKWVAPKVIAPAAK